MNPKPIPLAAVLLLVLSVHGATAAGFSAERGRELYMKEWPTPNGIQSCATCHTKDARREGLTRTNKVIKPLAPSANPERFTDPAKTEKWYRRNCGDVLGRECTPQEKGDFHAYLVTLK